ncbi:MAG: HAMP domain-containing histidine kinase [Chloroflexota bacterium]|nr:MAG: HAMP domain-containing histidine kinase [Chloroflexota bacterium]
MANRKKSKLRAICHLPSATMRRSLTFGIILLIAAPLAALALARAWLGAPMGELVELLRLFLIAETIALVFGFAAYYVVLRMGIGGISGKVALGYALCVGVTAMVILLVSMPMFISTHDAQFLLVLLVFSGIISLGFGYLISRAITRGLSELTIGAEKIAQGNFSARVNVKSGDEVERLGSAFNDMAEKLEQAAAKQKELEQARRDVVAAVSHDLRTPLASLRAMIEAINDGVVTDDATKERYLKSAQLQAENLSLLVDDLFELSQLDAGVMQWSVEPSSLRDLISDTLETMHVQAAEKNIKLSGWVDPSVDPVLMNSHEMQRVLYNLIQNAIRHTPADGTVFVEARQRDSGGEVQVDVIDTGEGIAEQDVPRIFDQFYRGEKSRARESFGYGSGGGAGLGLAIAQRIVLAHHGKIWVESKRGAGSRFSFTLPRVASK